MAKRRFVGVYNITMEQWYVIITFDLTWTQSVRPSRARNRPLSRRLDRCDRVIHNESGYPNGGNMCSFSGATCTSRVRHNADYVPYAKIRFDL